MKRRRKLRHYRLIAEPVSFVVTGATLKRRYGLGASDPAERAKDARSGAERRKRARTLRLGKRKADLERDVRPYVASLPPGAKIAEEIMAKYEVVRSTAMEWVKVLRKK